MCLFVLTHPLIFSYIECFVLFCCYLSFSFCQLFSYDDDAMTVGSCFLRMVTVDLRFTCVSMYFPSSPYVTLPFVSFSFFSR